MGAFMAIFAAQACLGAQSPPAKPDPRPDLSQACAGPTTTPVCALKTYLACVLYDAPHLCAAVGLEGIAERYPGPDTLDEAVLAAPWTLAFERLMPESFALHLYDGGPVPADRFQTTPPDALPTTGLEDGAYELILDVPEPYVEGLVYRLSSFYRLVEGDWRLVAWSSSRAKACDTEFGTAAWPPCRWFLKDLRQRNIFAADVTKLWNAPKGAGREDYPHPGMEIKASLPAQPVVAPFAGTVVRRSLKYPDVPFYDWVVIQGENRQANMTAKIALVDRNGPPPGGRIEAGAPLGRPQWVEDEHPGAGRFYHIELLRDGLQIDPRSVMRERKAR